MKEILYIQAGNQANYAGTHFWNTQESYFTYEEGEDPETDHGISFREGLNQKGEPTFCPRLLAFDHKAQFGTLSQANALFGMDVPADEQILWSGNPVEYKQEPVRQSQYQTDMEELDVKLQDVRYWSDFNRLYFVPRTVQKVPDVPEWADAEGNWTGGHEMFTRYDEDTGLMEGPLRLFLEECETIQGIQLIHDTATFGSFVNSLLTSLRDDFGKLPLLSWPLLSDATPFSKSVDTRRHARKLINDALTLRSLSELSSISVPIQSPTTWTDEVFSNTYIHSNRAHAFHTSAILSAHIETATLPLRSSATKADIQNFSGRLNWRTAMPFAELGGIFPHSGMESESRTYNFSSFHSRATPVTEFGRLDVTRGFSRSAITAYNERLNSSAVDISVVFSTHAAAYPLPTSFPAFFWPAPPTGPPSATVPVLSRPRSTPLFSSIGATSGTADLFSNYARFLDDSVRRKISLEDAGIDLDEMGDLANDFWTLHDTAGGETNRDDSDSDGRGEDED
ncbi:Misato segment II tubulin-like domain-containing protein [Mycena alexandri]|uniref:Misato segment II tubulin-like domain-containing protein n=1 Tax=Mycena alexandri TaxID=1745969 RepID=A0AAD6TJI3_9AGAR|nr:Misato segment II tubulin-like domain-containing protein [Mycena alexandri]